MRKPPRLPVEQLAPYILPTPRYNEPSPGVVDWRALFGNDHPVEIEVGSGKGLFLLTSAEANPGVNYLGIEIVRKYQLFTATRAARRGLTNLKTACADAFRVLREQVASGTVRTVHVYFPDPWWKNRHHKRRVFTEEFARECERVLVPGGELLVVTDVADYAVMVRETMAEVPGLAEAAHPGRHEPTHDMDYLTNFERKFRMEGREIHRMRYVKPQQAGAT